MLHFVIKSQAHTTLELSYSHPNTTLVRIVAEEENPSSPFQGTFSNSSIFD